MFARVGPTLSSIGLTLCLTQRKTHTYVCTYIYAHHIQNYITLYAQYLTSWAVGRAERTLLAAGICIYTETEVLRKCPNAHTVRIRCTSF